MTESEVNKSNKSAGRKIFRWGKVVIILYCGVGIALYYLQEKLMFHPESLPYNYVFKFDIPFKEVNIAMNANDNLNLVQFFPSAMQTKGVVLYFHARVSSILIST